MRLITARTYLTYLPHLPYLPHLRHLPHLPTSTTYLTYVAHLPISPTYLTYLPHLPCTYLTYPVPTSPTLRPEARGASRQAGTGRRRKEAACRYAEAVRYEPVRCACAP
jgi:hypothetical protein